MKVGSKLKTTDREGKSLQTKMASSGRCVKRKKPSAGHSKLKNILNARLIKVESTTQNRFDEPRYCTNNNKSSSIRAKRKLKTNYLEENKIVTKKSSFKKSSNNPRNVHSARLLKAKAIHLLNFLEMDCSARDAICKTINSRNLLTKVDVQRTCEKKRRQEVRVNSLNKQVDSKDSPVIDGIQTKKSTDAEKTTKHYLSELETKIMIKVEQYWAALNSDNVDIEKRAEIANELYVMMEGQLCRLLHFPEVFSAIKSMFIRENAVFKDNILKELQSGQTSSMKSSHVKNLLLWILKHITVEQREAVIKCIRPHTTIVEENKCNNAKLKRVVHEPKTLKRIVEDAYTESDSTKDKEKREEHTSKKFLIKVESQILMKANQYWATLNKSADLEKQMQLANEICILMKGHLCKLVHSSDISCVIKRLFIHGSETVKDNIFKELKNELSGLIKLSDCNTILFLTLKQGSREQKECIMNAMNQALTALLRHEAAVNMVKKLFNECTAVHLLHDFMIGLYQPTFVNKNNTSSLRQLLEKAPDKAESVLSYFKEALIAIKDESVFHHHVVHHILLEYLLNCGEAEKAEMVLTIRQKVVNLLFTGYGGQVGLQCILNGTTEDHQVIINSMNGRIFDICNSPGHIVLFAILDIVDDTRLIKEIILKEIFENIGHQSFDSPGRKVLLYLIDPTHVVDPDSQFSDFNAVLPKIMNELVFCPGGIKFVEKLLIKCRRGSLYEVFKSIVKLTVQPLQCQERQRPHIIDIEEGYQMLIHLIKCDKSQTRTIRLNFSFAVLKRISDENLRLWANHKNGILLILKMLETRYVSVSRVAKRLRPVMNSLKKQKLPNVELLSILLTTVFCAHELKLPCGKDAENNTYLCQLIRFLFEDDDSSVGNNTATVYDVYEIILDNKTKIEET
ncbi:hypothetical protein CHUAL_001216 [Chamberlinius hualienensis]